MARSLKMILPLMPGGDPFHRVVAAAKLVLRDGGRLL